MMKDLNYTQAMACEYARHRRCKCRCGGAMHGVKRGIPLDQLPLDDPHHTNAQPMSNEAKAFIAAVDKANHGD